MKHQIYVALDLEMNQPSRKIIQVGVVLGGPTSPAAAWQTRQWLLDPGEPIAPEIQELTGISDEDIQKSAVSWQALADELGTLIQANPCFVNPVTWGGGDAELLKAGFAEKGIAFPFFGRRWIDVKTWHTCQSLSEGKNPSGGLASVMGRYKVPFVGKAHRADVDAYNTLVLFVHLLHRQAQIAEILRLSAAVNR